MRRSDACEAGGLGPHQPYAGFSCDPYVQPPEDEREGPQRGSDRMCPQIAHSRSFRIDQRPAIHLRHEPAGSFGGDGRFGGWFHRMNTSDHTPPGVAREVIAGPITSMPPTHRHRPKENIAQYLSTIEAVKTRPAHKRAHGRRIK